MNGIRGWKFQEVLTFLELHNFSFHHQVDGSHEFWWDGKDGQHLVNINYLTGEYVPRTLETMIRQSKIEKEHWVKYTRLNSSQRKKKKCC